MRAKIEMEALQKHGVWLSYTDFDDPPHVPLPGEYVELYDPFHQAMWVGRIDTVNYIERRLWVACDPNETIMDR
jgi:hypothetical protein